MKNLEILMDSVLAGASDAAVMAAGAGALVGVPLFVASRNVPAAPVAAARTDAKEAIEQWGEAPNLVGEAFVAQLIGRSKEKFSSDGDCVTPADFSF